MSKSVKNVMSDVSSVAKKSYSTLESGLESATKNATKSFGHGMCYLCVVLILVYVAFANPSNTPRMFKHPLAKVLIFLLIFLVAYQNVVLGLVFGLAMVLVIVYAYKAEDFSNFIERFANDAKVHQQPLAHPPQSEEEHLPVHMNGGMLDLTRQMHHPESFVDPMSLETTQESAAEPFSLLDSLNSVGNFMHLSQS